MSKVPERIILGSGYVHLATFDAAATIADPQTFCTEANKYSYIQGGASIEY